MAMQVFARGESLVPSQVRDVVSKGNLCVKGSENRCSMKQSVRIKTNLVYLFAVMRRNLDWKRQAGSKNLRKLIGLGDCILKAFEVHFF